MASVVLTVVGSAIGGPIGGMVGGLIGQRLDQALFGGNQNRTLEGGRLTDLSVQTSAYGAPIARVYGTLRLPGNVIWSTGLQEVREEATESSGGKGGGSSVTTVTYRYSASFAVVLSGRKIHDVGQIWADGKLLRDAAGKLAVAGEMRIYRAGLDQQADPLIEALEGTGNVNAFHGLSYVVFEGLALAEYANRIPNLTFEVVADASGDVAVATIVADICALSDLSNFEVSALDQRAAGYMIPGPLKSRTALEELAQIYHFDVVEQEGQLVFRPLKRFGVEVIPTEDVVVGSGQQEGVEKITRLRKHDLDLPREIGLSFIDPDRDYQTGHQRARRQVGVSQMVQETSHALVLSAATAKAVSEVQLDLAWHGRETVSLTLPPKYADFMPGDMIALGGERPDQTYLLQQTELGPQGMVCQAVKFSPTLLDRTALADSGGIPPQTVSDIAPTHFFLLDMPTITAEDVTTPTMFWAANGGAGKWDGAGLFLSRDNGLSYHQLEYSSVDAVTGVVENDLPEGPTAFWDRSGELMVRLDQPHHSLAGLEPLSVLQGGNVAWVGGEILQFQYAELLPDGRYRLYHLLRGRRGTEHHVTAHGAMDPFVLLTPSSIGSLTLNLADIGQTVKFKAVTAGGDLDDVSAWDHDFQARVLTPFAPVHGAGRRDGEGNLTLSWIRRSRVGGQWQDHVDVALGERYEKYDIEILDGETVRRTLTSETTTVLYSAALQGEDFGAIQPSLSVRITQLSETVGRGWPLSLTV